MYLLAKIILILFVGTFQVNGFCEVIFLDNCFPTTGAAGKYVFICHGQVWKNRVVRVLRNYYKNKVARYNCLDFIPENIFVQNNVF